ncbi:MAG: hypothetical protein ACKPE6_03220 [Gammaproteobacteria bacterium]
MNAFLAKSATLGFYVAALLSLAIDMPPAVASVLQWGSMVLLVAHALEVVFCLRWIRLYEGPLAVSILLTLLFGFVHWMPYKRRAEAGA